MASATSSSAEGAPGGVVLRASAIYIAIVGAAVLAIRIAGGGRVADWAAFGAASAAIAAVTASLLLPRLRHLRQATSAARALASGDLGVHLPIGQDELAPLASALNAAAANLASTIAALRLERTRLEALLNASSDATVAVDQAGTVVYLNDAARFMLGAGSGERVGRPFIEVVRDHDLNDLMIASAQRGERSVRVVAYGQAQRWLQATAAPIAGGGAWAALAVFHDLTEVRRVEGVRRDFISNVSHELRTPLAGIRAAAETLREGALEDGPAAREFLSHIERETDRMTQLVEELLELSRIESGAAPLHFTRLDVSALVDETVRRFAQQAGRAGLTLGAERPAAPVTIVGDGERLEQALGNLVANAIKFTPEGGGVTVRASAGGGFAVVEVIDTGVGIDPEQQPRVFERFYKADRGRGTGGTGLGLAIVKHIVQAHGGTVAVESRPGRGSTFIMRLPRQ